jgi:ubiquinone/menaquinone biosynthesis C-methylase UbiE
MDKHTEQAVARFNDWSKTYGDDRISSWLKYHQSLALSKLNLPQGGGFLDVGCGTGWAVREAAKCLNGGQACGIDISPKMVEKAISQTPKRGNIEFRAANSEAIPYPNESFDAVLCTCSFHHYQNPIRALSEMKRVLKKGGTLVLLDSARDVSFAIWLQDRWRRYLERSHVCYYTTRELKSLVSAVDLHISEVTTIRKFMDRKKVFTGLALLVCTK